MRLRWLINDFSDPQHDLSRQMRAEVVRIAHEKYMPGSRLILWTIVGIVIPMGVYLWVTKEILDHLSLTSHNGAQAVTFAMMIAICWPLSAWVYGMIYTRSVRRAMRDIGREVCMGCGYPLEKHPAEITRCPECGRERLDVS